MNEALKEQIKLVHQARLLAVGATRAITLLREEWEDANAARMDAAQALYAARDEAEEKLREMTLVVWAQTGNKAPAPGVGIREVSRLEYQELAAYQWAITHTVALKLDIKAFEKIAKAASLDFVNILTEPQATIAGDLSEAVKEL